MARLTKRNQVAGRISAGTTAFQVMNIEHRIFRPAVTMLTNVSVSEKNILADVPEAELFALLVLFPRNVRILHLFPARKDLKQSTEHFLIIGAMP